MQGSPLPYDRKALYHAARIYTANARIRALSLSLRAPYYNLYANEVLTALRYVSSLTRGTNFPAIIIRAQAALLQAPASGAQEWSFNPSDVEIGFYEVEYAGYIFSDAWWNESGITASNRSAQLNVAKEDIMDAYKRPDTVPTTVDIQHMPSPMSAPISLAPSHSTPSPALPNYHTLRNAVTPRIPPPSQPALILSAERKRVHKGDAEDSTHAPSATKRPRGRPRKSEARPANKIIFVHRRLAEYEDESELPADAIIVRINSNRYLVGLSSSPRNIAQCEACSAAGATCFKGPNEACTLCSLRKRPCKPLQQSGLATRAVPLQDNARAKKGNRISDYFDKLPDTSAAANGIRPGILTGQSAQEFTPRRLTYTHERGELPRDTVVVIVRQGQPAEIIEYAVGLYSQNQSSTACMQCMKREVPCFPGPGDACTLCVLRDEPCAIFVHDDMEGTTRRHSKAYLELRRPADAELPMFIDQDEQFPEEYVVAELMLADRKRRTQRYLVGRYSWPRRKVECDTCREAGVPCLLNIHKKNPSASGCSLCSLRRAPCRPRRINEDEVEDDDEEESEQVATTTSVALRSASSRQKAPEGERVGEVYILPHRLGDKEDEEKYAANVIVAYVEKVGAASRYVVGVYGAPTNEAECEMCHYAITREGTRCPCLRSGEKRRGCVLCGLRRAPCVPYRPRAALVDATQPPQDEVHQPAPAAPARRSDEVPFSHLASEIDVEEHQMATTHIPTQLDASETSTRVDDQVQIAAALPDELSSAQKDDADADLREAEERMAELETKRREMLERQLAEQREMDRHLAGEREAFLQKMSLVFDKRVGMR